jgi:uncharacterized membrane protein
VAVLHRRSNLFHSAIFLLSVPGGYQQACRLCLVCRIGFHSFSLLAFLTGAYKEGDLSHVYPIMRSSPALVLIIAILFLGEQVSIQGVTGILLVAVGVYIINIKHISGEELLAPVKSLSRDRSTQFAFLTMISVALYSVVVKLAVDYIHPVLFAFFHLFTGICFCTPYIFFTKKVLK